MKRRYVRERWRGILGFAVCMALSPALRADEVSIRTEVKPELIRVVLSWPRTVSYETSVQGRELVLRFDRAIKAPQLEGLPRQAPGWIEGVVAGFDAVLFLAARDVEYAVNTDGSDVIIRMVPAAAVSRSSAEEEARAQLRLDLLQARLLAAQGRLGKTHELLSRLAKERPNDLNVLANLAGLEHQIGRWRRSNALYKQALGQDPDNAELLIAQTYVKGEQAARVRVDEERKSVLGRWSEQMTRISGHALVSDALRVGAVYDLNLVKVGQVQRTDGSLGGFDGARHRGELYVQHEFEGGSQLRGSIFGGQSAAGSGFYFSTPDALGQTSVQMDFRRPFWEFIEGTVDGGVRDRLELRRRLRVGSRLNGWGTFALNRYGISDDRDVATSIGFDAGLSYSVLRSAPIVNVEYGFDGEYRKSIDTRTTFAGTPFHPLPLLSREVHALSAVIGSYVVSHFRADGYGGFTYDRLGGKGPFFGIRFTYDTPADFGAQVWFDRRLNTINTGETVNRLGGRILWRF